MDVIQELTHQLFAVFQALEEQGIIDSWITLNYSLKEEEGINFFVDFVLNFCKDACEVLQNMALILQQPIVDYKELDEFCVKLLGSAACFGACRLKKSCQNFRKSIDSESREGCNSGLNLMNEEFSTLQTHLNSILEIENSIVMYTLKKD